MRNTRVTVRRVLLFTIITALFFGGSVHGAGEAGSPYLTRLFINNSIDLEEVQATLTLTKDDLNREGKIYISGDAADDTSTVRLVEYSLDGGENWETATGTEHWYFEFVPDESMPYEILIRVVNEAGATSREYGPWEISYRDVTGEEIATELLDRLRDCFLNTDRFCIYDVFSSEYDGNSEGVYTKFELEDKYDTILDMGGHEGGWSVRFQIKQINSTGDGVIVNTSWVSTSAEGSREEGSTKFWLARDDEYRIVHTTGDEIIRYAGLGIMELSFYTTGVAFPCDNGLTIDLFAPGVPSNVDAVTVTITIEACPGTTTQMLNRQDEYTFSGSFVLGQCGPFCTSCCPGQIFYDSPVTTLTSTFTDFGYDLLETILLP
jgi:hypothetical protein